MIKVTTNIILITWFTSQLIIFSTTYSISKSTLVTSTGFIILAIIYTYIMSLADFSNKI